MGQAEENIRNLFADAEAEYKCARAGSLAARGLARTGARGALPLSLARAAP